MPEIRQLTSCLDFGSSQWDTVITFACHELGGNQHFTYTKVSVVMSLTSPDDAVARSSANRLVGW